MVTEARKEAVREANRRFRIRHPGRVKASNRANYEANKIKARVRARESYRNNPEYYKGKFAEWRINNMVRDIWLSVRRRKDVSPELTEEYVAEILRPMRCSVTGLTLVWDPSTPRHPLRPSLDRIDMSKGYEPGNLRLVSLVYNTARSQYSDNEVLEYLVRPLICKVEARDAEAQAA